jgi:DNA-binding transcriptional regulator LsrR (DeoR family)
VYSSPVDSLCLAINTKQIRRIPQVIAIARGIQKADAILASVHNTERSQSRKNLTQSRKGAKV